MEEFHSSWPSLLPLSLYLEGLNFPCFLTATVFLARSQILLPFASLENVLVFQKIKGGWSRLLISASHPPDFGRGPVAKTCFSVQSTTHFNQQPVPPRNEILLKTLAVECLWKLRVCFRRQTSSRVFSSCCSALFTLAGLVRSRY